MIRYDVIDQGSAADFLLVRQQRLPQCFAVRGFADRRTTLVLRAVILDPLGFQTQIMEAGLNGEV